jgi:hypothetical protein
MSQAIEPPNLPIPLPRFGGVLFPVAGLHFIAGESIVERLECGTGVADKG